MRNIFIIFVVVVLAIIGVLFLIRGSSQKTENESLIIKGSDTEVQLVSNLVEAFLGKNPEADISVTGGGSGVGVAALLNREINLANSSRRIKEEELLQAKSKNSDVQEFILARDGLSIIVHPENQIEKLTVDEIGKIYRGEIVNWEKVGGKDKKVELYGRQSTSGTYLFFRNLVVKDDYSPNMKNMEGSQAIVDAVKSDKNGVGYVGVGYVKDDKGSLRNDIKIVPIAKDIDSPAISPLDKDAVKKGDYPISRPIFQYLSNLPVKNSLLDKFLLFEASDQGQDIIEKTGFYALTETDIIQNQLLFEKIK